MPTALITGVSGQDGSYLAEFLLSKGYHVVGMVRPTANVNEPEIQDILTRITVVQGDLLDGNSIINILQKHHPSEVYNLAAQSYVQNSWNHALLTAETTALGVTRVLEAIRLVDTNIRFYQASSSEMFGKSTIAPQNEETPFHPLSPYAISKVYGHFTTVNFRESYGMFTVSGILFNHESPRRNIRYVTRKISNGAVRIKLGLQDELRLGNLEARRDWGFAGDYVEAMWLMLQQDTPRDIVIGTGQTHSVRELCEEAFSYLDLDYRKYVVQDPKFFRPIEAELMVADITRAKEYLGWSPVITFEELVHMMVDADMALLKDGAGA
ncbi:MAG: GDP-mannose 4,6-dehydratase [Anaerolineaceae bacterium]|nr:GDP-mannose 4,6-dehydratase [Anaerolineaceae bacterium]